MINDNKLNTEERIKEAARKVFMKKGYKGATSRDIAKEAGLNVALTNYYFRKKEKLFKIIFMETAHEFLGEMIDILNRPIELSVKIRLILEKELETQLQNPDMFVLFYSEIKNNVESFISDMGISTDKFLEKWNEQIKENVRKKIIRKIDPMSALSIIMGYMHFPIIASSLLMKIGNYTDEEYNKFLDKQKEYAIEMVTNFLFLKK